MSANALKTDLYELTMAAGYFHNRVNVRATFELSCHTMPPNRSYLIVCGLQQAIDFILDLRFSDEEIKFLQAIPVFQKMGKDFFEYLRNFRFTGNVSALPEGEIFFAKEPILQIEAPIIEAQILETYLLSTMNLQSLVASKAARVVTAAKQGGGERVVVDFGSRRAHGPEAGVLAARAAYIGGCAGTSNLCAGKEFGIPVFGTMAHSWVESFETEEEGFEKYYQTFPDNTILLVDTYNTLEAVKKITQFDYKDKIKAVRLDSGDLVQLSKKVRKILDDAGLKQIKIIASGNLNEYKIHDLVKTNAPVDVFGVGTEMVTSRDYPALDLTYKLVQIEDSAGKVKLKAKTSPDKQTIPGKKQIYRQFDSKEFLESDTIQLAADPAPKGTQSLLKPMIENGRLTVTLPKTSEIREATQNRLAKLPLDFHNVHRVKALNVKFNIGHKMEKESSSCRL